MRPLTLGYLTLEDVPPADLVDAAAAAGFEAVGIRITGRHKTDPYFPVVGHPEKIREIRRRLDDTGVRLSNIGAYYVSQHTKAEDFQPIIDIAGRTRLQADRRQQPRSGAAALLRHHVRLLRPRRQGRLSG